MKRLSLMFSLLFIQLSFGGTIEEVRSFGENPGNLEMKKFVPSKVRKNAPLVVVFHGCSQNASDYARDAGWFKIAEEHGFYLLMPVQKQVNNFMSCFNWFERTDTTRNSGEALSIRSMVQTMLNSYSIDKKKVFTTGLSAGGAMALVMLATYPEVFKAGSVVAGIPYACATNMGYAFLCMKMQTTDRSGAAWGDLVRKANPQFKGKYPTVGIWQGSQDPHVGIATSKAVLKQWANVHGADLEADSIDQVNGHEKKLYKKNGKVVIETWLLHGHAHGQPVNPGSEKKECGSPAQWVLDSDICAAYYMAKSWGILNF